MDTSRYTRQIMLNEIGIEGQRKICSASVLIIGAGGLGSPVATYLAGAGVGRIGIADPDTVSMSNLQRQVLYNETCVGQPKTLCAAQRLNSINSEVEIIRYPDGITPGNAEAIINLYDLIIDCTDNFATRLLIDDTCYKCNKPWVYGSISAFTGQLAVMNYHRHRRYRDLFPEAETLSHNPGSLAGVVGVVPGVIGALQANEALKIITLYGDVLDGQLFYLDFKTLNNYIIEF